MSLNTVYRGQSVTADTYFYVAGTTTPLIVVGGVNYAIYSPTNLLVASGIATQDNTQAGHWTANFTIPGSAPITTGNQKYTITWSAQTAAGSFNNTDSFCLVDDTINNPVNPVTVAYQGLPFNINLQLPYDNIQTLSLRILNSNESVLVSMPNLNTTPSGVNGQNYVYTIPVTNLANIVVQSSYGGLGELSAYINYTDPFGNQQLEIQPVYIANAMLATMMRDIRHYMDMLRNNDAIKQLRYTEQNLIHFAYQGLIRFNGAPPQWVMLDFNRMQASTKARNMYFWVLKCAQLEIAEAMCLAEGMTAFDLQGMSVQLNSDRTQYLNNTIQSLRTDLDKLEKIKMQCARGGGFSGQIGTLGGVFGPNANFVYRIQPLTASGIGGAGYPVLPFLG